jgi:hypothetical protein
MKQTSYFVISKIKPSRRCGLNKYIWKRDGREKKREGGRERDGERERGRKWGVREERREDRREEGRNGD